MAAEFSVRAYNRTLEKGRPLAEKGATLVDAPHKVATSGGIVVSMVSDDQALEAVANAELIAALSPGGVHVSMSTVYSLGGQNAALVFRRIAN